MSRYDKFGRWFCALLLSSLVAWSYGYSILIMDEVAADSGQVSFGKWIGLIAVICGLLRGLPLALLILVFYQRQQNLRPFFWLPVCAMVYPVISEYGFAQPDEPYLRIVLSLIKSLVLAAVMLTGLYFAKLHLLKISTLKLNRGVLTSL